ncbi:MAG TPA: HRDC domain-containing protein [Kiritimatiellia bacterium]|nr:HRDC domain-containing protein [Kiritimatiellia bacterium]HRU71424.1 HRDC domain-containing protein [Kiritimatiellia bacterium]
MIHGAELITTANDLAVLAARLLNAEAVAVDTEFFWERTYYPVLGLVQLATAEGCWLVDAVAFHDLRTLGPVLAAPDVTKLLHDAPQDLAILARATGATPRTVFDTRVAAGFAGFSSTGALQALLRDALGVELAKAETRSDWLRRPLSAGQIRYAAEDVIHLIPLREALLARCSGDLPRTWLREELAGLDDAALYGDRDPRLMYQRVKGGSRLDARGLAVLREVAAWREEEARQRDWPRGHVLPDTVLVALAEAGPRDRAALAALPGFPRRMPDRAADALLAAVARGLALPAEACPQPMGIGMVEKRALKGPSDRLLARIRAACEAYGIDPALVASRADVESYLLAQQKGQVADHPLAQGWRAQLLMMVRT